MDENVIRELARVNPLFIRISLYGMDASSFSMYTGSNESAFNKVINNVKRLIQAKRDGRLRSAISLSFLMHPLLFPDVSIIDNFFCNHFSREELQYLSMIRFTPAVDYISGNQHEISFFRSIIDRLKRLSIKYEGATMIVPYTHRIDDLYKEKEYEICKASGYFAEVSPNGDLYLCCEKLMDSKFIIGNIIDNEISEVYKSSKRMAIINGINEEKCSNCPSLCKPHEMNKQLNQIEKIQRYELDKWRDDLVNMSDNTPYFPGKFNAFES